MFLLLAFACVEPPQRDNEDDQPAGNVSAETAPSAAQPDAAPLELPDPPDQALPSVAEGVELLEAGATPREALRFAPAEGQVERLSARMAMSVSVSGAGIPPMSQRTPPVEQHSRVELVALEPDQLRTKIVFEALEQAQGTPAGARTTAMLASARALEGFEQTRSFSRRGGLIDGSLDAPPGADPKLDKSLRTLGVNIAATLIELPSEAIGVGAKWRQSARFSSNGLAIERTTEAELLGREGKKLLIGLRVSEQTTTTKFEREGTPGEVEVARFDSRGSGLLSYELDKLLPTRARLRLDTELSFTLSTSEDPSRTVDTQVELELDL